MGVCPYILRCWLGTGPDKDMWTYSKMISYITRKLYKQEDIAGNPKRGYVKCIHICTILICKYFFNGRNKLYSLDTVAIYHIFPYSITNFDLLFDISYFPIYSLCQSLFNQNIYHLIIYYVEITTLC